VAINIYYSQNRKWANELCDYEPQPLLTSEYYKSLPFNTYRRCYSNLEYFKNVFIMKSPFKFDMRLENESLKTYRDQEWFDNYIDLVHSDEGVIQFLFGTTFFSDSDVEMSQIPASLHNNSFTRNTRLLSGTMNISKWFRPVHAAILWTNDFDVENNDALFYLKFHTDEKINFKKFKMSEELEDYQNDCMTLKQKQPRLNFKKIYDMFTKRNFNDKIMKEIKKNLME